MMQLFVWRWKGQTELSTFAMTRCVMGNKPSTSISCMAVMLIAENNNNNIYFGTKIKNIYAYTITNTAYQPITREMFEIGSRIRSIN